MHLPLRHQIIDAVAGGETLVVAEHQLPEIKIPLQLLDVDQISSIPQGNVRQSSIDRFMEFVRVNIGLIIAEYIFRTDSFNNYGGISFHW